MISRNKLKDIIVGARERARSEGRNETPHLDAIIDVLDKHPEMLNMEIILKEIKESKLNKEEQSCVVKKIMTIPIV